MSNSDFRDHIKAICLGPNYIRRSDPALVRKPTDRGYYPPAKPKPTQPQEDK